MMRMVEGESLILVAKAGVELEYCASERKDRLGIVSRTVMIVGSLSVPKHPDRSNTSQVRSVCDPIHQPDGPPPTLQHRTRHISVCEHIYRQQRSAADTSA
jgi:hypothetical protein